MENYIYIALKDLQNQLINKDFNFANFLLKHNLPMRFYPAILKIGLIQERKNGKKYQYKWVCDEPTINDAKFIKSYL